MAKHRFDKLFSADEANELIPRLEILVRKLQMQAQSLRERIEALGDRDDSILGLDLPDIIDRYPELKPLAAKMAETASEIESLGCFLKDIDQGLIDFPCERGEELVFLCWQFGEPRVLAWHPIDGGFAGRQPLPGAPKFYLN